MEYVIEHCNHDNRSVFRNNLEIAKTLVECWKDHIQIPTKLALGFNLWNVVYNHNV